jgi:hypothetical protein
VLSRDLVLKEIIPKDSTDEKHLLNQMPDWKTKKSFKFGANHLPKGNTIPILSIRAQLMY